MAKRSATNELNRDNWDQEDEPVEPGVFQKASAEVLETRVIKTAKRRVRMSDSSSDAKSSPFSGFTGFGNATSTSNLSSPFSFLSQNKTSEGSDKIETKQDKNTLNSGKDTQLKSFNYSFLNSNQSKDSSNLTQNNTTTTSTTPKPFEHIFKANPFSGNESSKDKKEKNLELLKDLNLSCSSWISEHLQKNPYCILTPIFKDYEKHLSQLELNTHSEDKEIEIVSEKTSTNNSFTQTAKFLNTSKEETSGSSPFEKIEKEKPKTTEFKFESTLPKPQFQFSENTTFGGVSTPFSLNQIGAKPIVTESESKNDEDSEEPPKNEFVPVVEEDSVFDMKCKIFVKKEGNYVPKGIGTLFLKPVKDTTKTQLIVRAHTSLGNILLNTLLTPGMPIQKTGKNNAMIVCVPTPESQPPPVPVLIRVKTSEECDSLIKKLEECRGS